MEWIYCGRSRRRLDKEALITLVREQGISDQEFLAWLDISIDDFADLNRNLRYETFKSQIDDYLQTGRLRPNEIRGVRGPIRAGTDFGISLPLCAGAPKQAGHITVPVVAPPQIARASPLWIGKMNHAANLT